MKDTRHSRIWTLAGVFALALTLGVASKRLAVRRAKGPAVEEGLRDAVASPAPPATAALAGRPVPTSWFKTPAQESADMEAALLSSRRRRELAQRVAVQ